MIEYGMGMQSVCTWTKLRVCYFYEYNVHENVFAYVNIEYFIFLLWKYRVTTRHVTPVVLCHDENIWAQIISKI